MSEICIRILKKPYGLVPPTCLKWSTSNTCKRRVAGGLWRHFGVVAATELESTWDVPTVKRGGCGWTGGFASHHLARWLWYQSRSGEWLLWNSLRFAYLSPTKPNKLEMERRSCKWNIRRVLVENRKINDQGKKVITLNYSKIEVWGHQNRGPGGKHRGPGGIKIEVWRAPRWVRVAFWAVLSVGSIFWCLLGGSWGRVVAKKWPTWP